MVKKSLRVFRTKFHDISKRIDNPGPIAERLFGEGLISQASLARALMNNVVAFERMGPLLREVYTAVDTDTEDPVMFNKLCNVLMSFSETEAIGIAMYKEYHDVSPRSQMEDNDIKFQSEQIAKDYGLKLPKNEGIEHPRSCKKKTSCSVPAENTEKRATNEVANTSIANGDSNNGAEEPDFPSFSNSSPGEEGQLNSAPNGELNGRLEGEADDPSPLVKFCISNKKILMCLGVLVLMIFCITLEYMTYGTPFSFLVSITFIIEYCIYKSAVSMILFPGIRLYFLKKFLSSEGILMLAIILLALIYDFNSKQKLKGLMLYVISLLSALSAFMNSGKKF